MNVKMRVMGTTGKVKVPKLNDETAVDLGAELIGEFFIYSIASAGILAEYYRSSRKEQQRLATQDESFETLQSKVKELELNIEQQSAELRNINRLVQGMRGLETGGKTTVTTEKSKP